MASCGSIASAGSVAAGFTGVAPPPTAWRADGPRFGCMTLPGGGLRVTAAAVLRAGALRRTGGAVAQLGGTLAELFAQLASAARREQQRQPGADQHARAEQCDARHHVAIGAAGLQAQRADDVLGGREIADKILRQFHAQVLHSAPSFAIEMET